MIIGWFTTSLVLIMLNQQIGSSPQNSCGPLMRQRSLIRSDETLQKLAAPSGDTSCKINSVTSCICCRPAERLLKAVSHDTHLWCCTLSCIAFSLAVSAFWSAPRSFQPKHRCTFAEARHVSGCAELMSCHDHSAKALITVASVRKWVAGMLLARCITSHSPEARPVRTCMLLR